MLLFFKKVSLEKKEKRSCFTMREATPFSILYSSAERFILHAIPSLSGNRSTIVSCCLLLFLQFIEFLLCLLDAHSIDQFGYSVEDGCITQNQERQGSGFHRFEQDEQSHTQYGQ